MLEYIFGTVRYICTEAYIGGTSSHVQRLLVHVHMYTMYYLSVVLILFKDVARLCSSGVKSGKPYTSPHFTPPPGFFPREKKIFYTPYHMNFAQGKKNACCVARYALA